MPNDGFTLVSIYYSRFSIINPKMAVIKQFLIKIEKGWWTINGIAHSLEKGSFRSLIKHMAMIYGHECLGWPKKMPRPVENRF